MCCSLRWMNVSFISMVLFICVIWESRSRWRVAWYWSGWGETFLSFVKYHNSFCSAGAYWEAFACTSALTGSALLSPSPIIMVIHDLISGTTLWGYILHWENDSTPHSEFSLRIWANKREVICRTRVVSYHLDWSMKLHVRGFPFQAVLWPHGCLKLRNFIFSFIRYSLLK